MQCTLGFKVRSGWAITVLVGGPATRPVVLDRRRVELSDPEVPDARQPYHAGFGTEQTDREVIAKLERGIRAHARRSMASLVRHYTKGGYVPKAAGLVVGSDIDPAAIANPHIRAHASEGRLFRTVLQEALDRHQLRWTVFIERELHAIAVKRLRQPEQAIKDSLTALRTSVAGSWRAEDKAAALAGWLVLR